mmetsp:Transcript_1362/g.3997  ORF Transcript_1362/g.3997 Transcript_1362/m.3997 type:complete len:157 (+) Transcript_1362:300-770(+)
MSSAGIKIRGAYHFGHPGTDAGAQADHFLSVVGALHAGDLVALDIETSDGQSASTVAAWCKAFVDRVVSKSGLPASRVLVYTGAWFWNPQAGGSASVGDHPLWVSGYTTSPPVPKGWTTWTFWQYTDKQTVPGVSSGCDASRFNGDMAALNKLAGI